jgi:hypothetical protein
MEIADHDASDEESTHQMADDLSSSSSHGLLESGNQPLPEFDLEDVLNAMDAELQENPKSTQGSDGGPVNFLGNNQPIPITRVPTNGRDTIYAAAFWFHFIIIIMLSLLEGASLETSLIEYGKAGSWASFFMIATLLGAFLGCLAIFMLANWSNRDEMLSFTIPFSIFSQLVFGITLVAMNTRYSFLASLVFLSALVDSFKYHRARESVGFASAVLSIVISVLNRFGLTLVVTCICLILTQTFILLWWGSFFVGLIASVHEAYADILSVVMFISLYWTQQVFQALISYIVGGCCLWYFVKRDAEELNPQQRVLLHLQCGLTAGFGSVCKGALYSNIAMYVLEVNDWSKRLNEGGKCSRCVDVIKAVGARIVKPFLSHAQCFHRLGFCIAATYGRTFRRSATDHFIAHEETLNVAIEDTTTHILSAMAKQIPAVLALILGVCVETAARDSGTLDITDDSSSAPTTARRNRSWCLFFLVCYMLAYSGCSLALSTYRAAVDALIVAFGEKPDKLAKENQIVFSRFLRLMERHERTDRL